jgi:octaprenyl-diphosphate synthase
MEKSSSTPSLRRKLKSAIQKTEGLAEVEELIRAKLTSSAGLLSEIPLYLFNLGGKRIRPLLTLITAKAFNLHPPSPEVIKVSAGIELIHMATLLHDDIIDHSSLRRHQESPLAKYGMVDTLLSGDFLLIRAFGICAHLDPYIIDLTERACVELTEGEILETPLFEYQHDLESALNIAVHKTASLFKLATQCAAYLAGTGSDAIVSLAELGLNLGIAFQILDDILDVTASQEALGKSPGTDLLERKPSIVNVLWLQSGTQLSQTLFSPPCKNSNFVEKALSELRGSEVIKQAKSLAVSYAAKAKENLQAAVQSSLTETNQEALGDLNEIIDFIVERAQ